MSYFGIIPAPSYLASSSSSSVPLANASSTPIREYVSNSASVIRATLEDKPLDVGSIVQPCYDSEQTISSNSPNPFTNPRMSELDRFEYATDLGLDVLDAHTMAKSSSYGSAPVPSVAESISVNSPAIE